KGLLYQCLLYEGKKNIMGAYYTPHAITNAMTQNLDFSKGQILLDPACGSGAFFMSLQNAKPSQIFGIDNDPIAVFIAKINLLLKFKNDEFIPQIYCVDFLESSTKTLLENTIQNPLQNTQFDYVITNPPWGIYRNNTHKKPQSTSPKSCEDSIISGERFSLFFVKSYKQLKPNGIMKFLLPKSMLNVKTHKDLREFILSNGTLQEITHYANIFSGVSTEFVSVEHKKEILESRGKTKSNSKSNPTKQCKIITNKQTLQVPLSAFHISQNLNFNPLNAQDIAIIQKVKAQGKFDLSASIWALGIVTGDNKNALHKEQILGSEKIFTGKEIVPYRLQKARNFIMYDRTKFQQVAKDEMYRASEKLVYKFISNKLIFAYDNSGALFLNSANILIPRIPNMSIKTALGFLNSELFAYLH
ncbi:Eco57I restriction-modification methylase domain-containing protein, partial [Helicobacter sp. T3_23-1059]